MNNFCSTIEDQNTHWYLKGSEVLCNKNLNQERVKNMLNYIQAVSSGSSAKAMAQRASTSVKEYLITL